MVFTDEGTPSYYDTNGYLYLKSSAPSLWIPIGNLRDCLKHKMDNYWVVGLSERLQIIKAILCKTNCYPKLKQQKPIISLIPMQVPLCELEIEKSQIEKDYLTSSIIMKNLRTAVVYWKMKIR